jgi:DNA polymerase III subunit delta'
MPFRDIVGHRTLVGLLVRSIERGTLPPSLILAGPSGVGKRLAAVSVAQAMNCPNPLASGPVPGCGVCPTCARIARGVHPDVNILEPGDSGTIKIDQVRDVVDRAAYRPFEGRHRVVIIDQADALVVPAQNALLKTLEEPPSASSFLLVTSAPDLLLPTVRSRCPRLTFRPLDADDVATVLMSRSETEARAVAATADGSVGRALEASAGDLVEARDVALRALASVAGTPPGAPGDLPRRRVEAAKELLPKTGGAGVTEREQLAGHLRAMSSILRDVALIAAGADGQALANPDVRPAIDRLSAYSGDRGTRAFVAVDQGLVALERNAAAKIVADWVMLQL